MLLCLVVCLILLASFVYPSLGSRGLIDMGGASEMEAPRLSTTDTGGRRHQKGPAVGPLE